MIAIEEINMRPRHGQPQDDSDLGNAELYF